MAMVFVGKTPMIVMYTEKVVEDPLFSLVVSKIWSLIFSSGET